MVNPIYMVVKTFIWVLYLALDLMMEFQENKPLWGKGFAISVQRGEILALFSLNIHTF